MLGVAQVQMTVNSEGIIKSCVLPWGFPIEHYPQGDALFCQLDTNITWEESLDLLLFN